MQPPIRKTGKPWFSGYDLPRRAINLLTRLRTGHICVGEYFRWMRWNIDLECPCGAEMSSLWHLIYDCPQLSEGRDDLLGLFVEKF